MFSARSLPGLPPYGPRAKSFPDPDAFREGFVVEFALNDDEVWVGNFAGSSDCCECSIQTELGSRAVVVVAGSHGYIVDLHERRLVHEIGPSIESIWFDNDLQVMIVTNGLWFEALDAQGVVWRSRRFSWDGMRKVAKSGRILAGEAYDPVSDTWLPFRLHLDTGEVEGGSYNGPDI